MVVVMVTADLMPSFVSATGAALTLVVGEALIQPVPPVAGGGDAPLTYALSLTDAGATGNITTGFAPLVAMLDPTITTYTHNIPNGTTEGTAFHYRVRGKF